MLSFKIGAVLVVLSMVLYYRLAGLVADLGLIVNLILLMGMLTAFQATLTLPGIAGIVLTMGMAVDANVLINERIREELKVGATPWAAINAGFDKAFSAIADSNVTMFLSGIVLFLFGSGPVRGFAVTMMIGIVASMFTALIGSRALIHLFYGRRRRIERLAI